MTTRDHDEATTDRRAWSSDELQQSMPDDLQVVAVRDDGALLVALSTGNAAAVMSDDGVWVTTRDAALARGTWAASSGEVVPTGVLADKLSTQLAQLNAENDENDSTDDEADVTAAAEVHTGAMIALVPSDADLARLAVEGGEPADQLHTTILYLGDAVSYTEETREALIDCLSECAAHLAPFVVDGFAIALFNPVGSAKSDGKQRNACVTLMVSGEELEPVRYYIWNDFAKVPTPFGLPDQHTPWIPHITLTYTDDTNVAPYSGLVGSVTFTAIRVAFGGEVYDLPLGEERDDEPDYDDNDDSYGGMTDGDEIAAYAVALAQRGPSAAVPGSPGHQLHEFWTKNPKGLAKWADKPHPWTALYHHLRKYIHNDEEAKATAAKWFHDVKGYWPGDQKGKNPVGPG